MEFYSHQSSMANISTGIRKYTKKIKLSLYNAVKVQALQSLREKVLFPSGALTGKKHVQYVSDTLDFKETGSYGELYAKCCAADLSFNPQFSGGKAPHTYMSCSITISTNFSETSTAFEDDKTNECVLF